MEQITITIYRPMFESQKITQSIFTCSKPTMETLEKGVKYVQR